MKWAIYRIHYGLDFIENSINSIINDIDKIFIFIQKSMDKKDTKNIRIKLYLSQIIQKMFPFLVNKYKNNKKIIIKEYECNTPLNQFGKLFNLAYKLESKKPKYVIFMEPDIFGKNQIKILKFELNIRFWLKILQQDRLKYGNIISIMKVVIIEFHFKKDVLALYYGRSQEIKLLIPNLTDVLKIKLKIFHL